MKKVLCGIASTGWDPGRICRRQGWKYEKW